MKHAQKFFGNLLVPLAPKVLKKLEQVGALGLQIRTIAPSHGVIWRTNAGGIVEAYANWSQGAAKDKVTIVYDTMHGSTTALAYALAEGLMDEGCEVKVCLLGSTHRSDIVAEVLDSKAVLVGSPTLADTLPDRRGLPVVPERAAAGPARAKEARVRVRFPRRARRGRKGGLGMDAARRRRGDRRRDRGHVPADKRGTRSRHRARACPRPGYQGTVIPRRSLYPSDRVLHRRSDPRAGRPPHF